MSTTSISKKVISTTDLLSGKDVIVESKSTFIIKEIKEGEQISTQNKKEYLGGTELLNQILESKRLGQLTPKAQTMFYILGNNVIKKKRYFYNPDDRKDCLQTGLMDLYSNWKNFDPEKSNNAFAYFTEIFKRGMARGFNQLNKRKGDPKNESVTISINSSNDGDGMFNF